MVELTGKKRARSSGAGCASINYEQRLLHRSSIMKNKPRFWSEKELKVLKAAVEKLSGTVSIQRNFWSEVSNLVATRTGKECAQCWEKVANPNIKKGRWSEEEDDALIMLLVKATERGEKIKWSKISQQMKTRSSKQCRERWINQLNPDLKKDEWSEEEEQKLVDLYKQYPNKWSLISHHMPGRTENMVKYRYFQSCDHLEAKKAMKKSQTCGNRSFCPDIGEQSRKINHERSAKKRRCDDKQIHIRSEEAMTLFGGSNFDGLHSSNFQNQDCDTENYKSNKLGTVSLELPASCHKRDPWWEVLELLSNDNSEKENFIESDIHDILELLDDDIDSQPLPYNSYQHLPYFSSSLKSNGSTIFA